MDQPGSMQRVAAWALVMILALAGHFQLSDGAILISEAAGPCYILAGIWCGPRLSGRCDDARCPRSAE